MRKLLYLQTLELIALGYLSAVVGDILIFFITMVFLCEKVYLSFVSLKSAVSEKISSILYATKGRGRRPPVGFKLVIANGAYITLASLIILIKVLGGALFV